MGLLWVFNEIIYAKYLVHEPSVTSLKRFYIMVIICISTRKKERQLEIWGKKKQTGQKNHMSKQIKPWGDFSK